jgi:hypothetical protein
MSPLRDMRHSGSPLRPALGGIIFIAVLVFISLFLAGSGVNHGLVLVSGSGFRKSLHYYLLRSVESCSSIWAGFLFNFSS